MYSEEIFIKLTKDQVIRCYRALELSEKMLKLYRKRTNRHIIFHPEDLESEFYDIVEEYLKKDDKKGDEE